MNLLVAVAQMNSKADINANFDTVADLCKHAKGRGASFVCFPENFAFLPELPADTAKVAETLDGPLFTRYRDLARQNQIEISFGGFPERASDGRMFNTHVIVDRNANIVSTYRKIHLFVVDLPGSNQFDEAAHYHAGTEVVIAKSSIGTLGLSICYDLRFAELFHKLSLMGAEIMLVPAAFTALTGKAHWEVLLRARAIENQCYVLAAAQHGQHGPARFTHGHAMIVDPWGSIVAQCSETTSIAFAEVDLTYLQRIRANMPMAAHRRL